ncbi:MAG: hypothetical protein ACI4TN_01860 [Candidatus Enterosoma sp.]
MDNNELYHYGVLGMKWGVRRSRPSSSSKTGKKRKQPVYEHEDYIQAHSKKSVKSMSDAELRRRLNRLQMEKQYKELNPGRVNKGKKYINSFIKTGATAATVTTTGLTTYNNVDKIRKIIEGKK